jgi:ribosomal subunit interface protein
MKITTLKFTNLESSVEIENYLEKKMSQLDKYLAHVDTPHKLFVELAKTTEHHKTGKIFYAEADIVIPGGHLRATAESYDITNAIDILKDELDRQLKSLKDKHFAKDRKARKAAAE